MPAAGDAPGRLDWQPALDRPDLLAPAVAAALGAIPFAAEVLVAPIDADLADTAAFCERYEVGLDVSANCVVVAGKRAGATSYAACLVLATHRLDVNGAVRTRLAARKASFAPLDEVVAATGMEYGGITPFGVPGWPVLVDAAAAVAGTVVVGSGIRGSKLAVPSKRLAELPAAEVAPLTR
jgi:prolyl-tRNA editing enzyme YbaK/EbsC (Cys-tRNA(Pro) deacylase)